MFLCLCKNQDVLHLESRDRQQKDTVRIHQNVYVTMLMQVVLVLKSRSIENTKLLYIEESAHTHSVSVPLSNVSTVPLPAEDNSVTSLFSVVHYWHHRLRDRHSNPGGLATLFLECCRYCRIYSQRGQHTEKLS